MSTRGVFIIRKDGAEKAMKILHDAYPDGAGVDIIDLVKTTDLDALCGCLTEYDEWDMPDPEETGCPDEPVPFSYDICRLAVKNRKQIWTLAGTRDYILDSLFCEYGYVLDLNREELLFFKGGQTKPQEENPYGTEPEHPAGVKEAYYPCRLAAVFPLAYVRRARSGYTAHEMELSEKAADIRRFSVDGLPEEAVCGDDYTVHKVNITMVLSTLNDKIGSLMEAVMDANIVSKNRLRGVTSTVMKASELAREVERQIEILT